MASEFRPVSQLINEATGWEPHKVTVYRLRKEGKIRCWMIGGRWMTTKEEVERWLEKHGQQGKQ